MNLCDRFHCLPSALMEEDAELLGLVALVERGKLPEPPGSSGMPGPYDGGGGW